MKTSFILMFLIVVFSITTIIAQNDCGTVIPAGVTVQQAQSGNLTLFKRSTMTEPLRLAIHIVRTSNGSGGISESSLNQKITALYNIFQQVYFQFEIKQTDYIDSDQLYWIDGESEVNQLLTTNNKPGYINIYFISTLSLNYEYLNGLSTFSPRINSTGIHGIIVTNSAHLTTLPHEMGHYFDLFHTFETLFGYENIARTGSCTNGYYTGDLLMDTPADPSARVIFATIDHLNCQWINPPLKPLPLDGCNQNNYQPLANNMMHTQVPQCRSTFTNDQIDRMNETLQLYRNELLKNMVYLENRIGTQNASGTINVGSNSYQSGNYAFLNEGSYTFRTNNERFANFQNTSFNYKHNNWNLLSSKLYLENIDYIQNEYNEEIAMFNQIKYAKAIALLEELEISNKGEFEFKDPWYVKSDGTQPGNYWIPCVSSYEPTGKHGATEKGVFLNQGWPGWNPPYYSVQASIVQDILFGGQIGTRAFYFQGWSGTNASFQNANNLTTGVVFTNGNGVVNANYKGQGISNQQDAYTSNSQRKAVRLNNSNYLLNVYKSLDNKVWLEESYNNGESWYLKTSVSNGGYPNGEPSIDYIPEIGEPRPFAAIVHSLLELAIYRKDANIPFYSKRLDANYLDGHAEYVNPVVAATSSRILVVFNNGLDENGDEGLGYLYGYITPYPFDVTWTEGTYPQYKIIPGTSERSKNISIAADKTTSNVFHITWNEGNNIKYCKATGSGNSLTFSTVETPSTSSTYSSNLYPSISLANGNPVISWTGGAKLVADKIAAKETAINESRAIVRRKGTSWGDFQITGNSVNYTNNNSVNTTEEKTVIVWSEGNPPSSKWFSRTGTTYSTPANLSHSGIQVQLIHGSDYNNMTSIVFNSSQLPYYFTKTTTDFTGIPQEEMGKISNLLDSVVTYGRTGIINAGGADFVFNTGDILVGDEIIEFIDKPDTTVYSSDAELNVYTRTKNFTLENNSSFYLSNIYYVLNKDSVGELLGENDNVNFKVELVRVAGEQVVGVFDDIDYNRNSLDKYANIFYEVDCSGIQPGEYYLRLVTTVEGMVLSGEVNYTLANLMNESSGLEKRQMTKVGFTGTEKPVTYELFQNYPNPFNPVTTITYQIPKEGLVTLKIYDILGKEVTTLLNEEKQAGKYSIEFNASKLSSGVYLYELRSNEYKSTKKLLLMK